MISMFCIVNIMSLNLYFADKAGVNAGIMTVIWRLNVFMSAFSDRIMYKQELKYFHVVGLVSITVCVVLIGIDKSL